MGFSFSVSSYGWDERDTNLGHPNSQSPSGGHKKRIKRSWSFSGLASMARIMLIYYVNCYTSLEEPETDWAKMVQEAKEMPPEPSLRGLRARDLCSLEF